MTWMKHERFIYPALLAITEKGENYGTVSSTKTYRGREEVDSI